MRKFLDVDQVAEALGVDPCFIRRLVWERRIPYSKIGKYVRFDPDEIEAWRAKSHHPTLR